MNDYDDGSSSAWLNNMDDRQRRSLALFDETNPAFADFVSNNADAIQQDNDRGDTIRARLAPIFGYDKLYRDDGIINSIGITVESHGVGNLRLNMDIAVMEQIVDHYENLLQSVYDQLDAR